MRWEFLRTSVGFTLLLPACGTPSSETTSATVCTEETGVGDVDGDAEGCAFVPYCAENEDDGSTEKLDVEIFSDLGCEPDCPPPQGFDPPNSPFAEWDYHSGTDTYYRHASEMELEVHGWVEGTTLISAETNVAGLMNGSTTVTFGVPVTTAVGIDMRTVLLSKTSTRSDAWYLSAEDTLMGPAAHAFRPEFHLYLPSWVDFDFLRRPMDTDLFVWVYGDSHGGVAMQGMTADQEFAILGPTSKVWLETLPPDHAGVLIVTPTFRATDFDDVLDHWVDVVSNFCENNDCDWAPSVPIDPGNCDDCIDNDQDVDVDGNDIFCQDRDDFGCLEFGAHNHRWEIRRTLQ